MIVIKDLKTNEFNWGGFKEKQIKYSTDIHVNNINIGLQSSSFQLKEGIYRVLIGEELNQIFTPERIVYKFEGIPQLSGSEKDNLFLEEHQMTKKHIRYYGLLNNSLSFLLSKDFLLENKLLNKKITIYLVKD